MSEYQSRYVFPHPSSAARALMFRIGELMLDGTRRSVIEIQDALGTRKEIGARIRDSRHEHRWPFNEYEFNDARRDGPDDDGVYRYILRRKERAA